MGFPFLKLPPELRNQVYKELLPHRIVIVPDIYGFKQSGYLEPGSSALLRTCRLIQEEACNILYRHNTFRFDDKQGYDEDPDPSDYGDYEDGPPPAQLPRLLGFHPFLLAIGAHNRFRLRKISFDIVRRQSLSCPDAYGIGKAFRLLAHRHSLRIIEFRLHCEDDFEDEFFYASSALRNMFESLVDGGLNKDLRQIKGIKELQILGKDLLYGKPGCHQLVGIEHLGVEGMKGLKKLKKAMEIDVGPFQKAVLEATSRPSKVRHDKTSVKRLASLVEEYKDLTRQDQKLNTEKAALKRRLVKLDGILRKVEFAMQDSD